MNYGCDSHVHPWLQHLWWNATITRKTVTGLHAIVAYRRALEDMHRETVRMDLEVLSHYYPDDEPYAPHTHGYRGELYAQETMRHRIAEMLGGSMSKNVVRNNNWLARASEYSTHGSKTGVNLLGWDIGQLEHMSPEQEREALKARARQLHEAFTSGEIPKADRARLGLEMHEIGHRIKYLRPKLRHLRGLPSYISDVVKERVTACEWRSLVNEAMKRYNRAIQDGLELPAMNPLDRIPLSDETAKRVLLEVADRLRKPWQDVTMGELKSALPEAVQKVRYSK